MDANPDLVLCPWEFTITEETEAFVILITKGETALLNIVNEALAKAYADGLYGTWYEDAVALSKSENAAEVSVEDCIANNKLPAVGDLSGGRRGRIRP